MLRQSNKRQIFSKLQYCISHEQNVVQLRICNFKLDKTAFLPQRSSFSTFESRKSWIPTEAESLQKLTTQALIHEVTIQQYETAAKVVPWYLTNMPAAYFRQTDPELRKQHLQTIQAIRELKQADLSLKIDTKNSKNEITDTTYIASHASKGLLNKQISTIKVPIDSYLSRVKAFSSLDNELALNIFSFQNFTKSITDVLPTEDDAKDILELMEGVKLGQYLYDTSYDYLLQHPELLTKAKILDYLQRVSVKYVTNSNPRHFLLQYSLFQQVQGTDGTAVAIQSVNTTAAISSSSSSSSSLMDKKNIHNTLLPTSIDAAAAYLNNPLTSEPIPTNTTPSTTTNADNLSSHHTTAVSSLTTLAWVTIAAANVLPDDLLKMSSMILTARNLNIDRAHLDIVRDEATAIPGIPQSGYVTMLRLLVTPDPAQHSTIHISQNEFKTILQHDLKRLKWLDDETLQLGLVRHPALGLKKAEVITAICAMLHGPLSKLNPQAYASVHTILNILDASPHFIQIADSIASVFLERFRPQSSSSSSSSPSSSSSATTNNTAKPTTPQQTEGINKSDNSTCHSALSDTEFQKVCQEISTKITRLHHEAARNLLVKMLETVKQTLRTNFYNENRYALSLRLNPIIMMNTTTTPSSSSTNSTNNNTTTSSTSQNQTIPFGVFFSHGRNFNGFHCRFRDIARGGLRIVTPANPDQYILESSRQFDEAYGLSFAQQLKNKDIPEGGAKAVVLVNASIIEPSKRFYAARTSVKAFTDSILDLIVQDSVKGLVDYYKNDELVYLGPDEQVIPSDVDWIIERAAQRGYPIPAAFMSSKKGAGINHKEYGVTSEGIVVYLDVALKNVLNIDPRKQPFTIKITGGPDGDVAGNLMKILFREYGDNCKIVGVADGFGVAEDPTGLSSDELLRLVTLSQPITSFDKSKLSATGILMDITTEEGLARRLSLPFRVKADAFIPAGGRPNTINGDNWRQYLDPITNEPCSKLMVEGANIFNTQEARENLFKYGGVIIVKDSSANKCGVITSSCEVAASMLLTKEEFMSVKTELVSDVLDRLRVLARLEAELLFRSFKNYPGTLPHFSERISMAIGKVKDAVIVALEHVQPTDALFVELMPLIRETLPRKLAEVAWDRASTRLPVQYQRCAIASALASKLVYQEGIHLVESQPIELLAEHAFMYYREQVKIEKLIRELETNLSQSVSVTGAGSGSSMGLSKENHIKLIQLVKRGGTRASLDIF